MTEPALAIKTELVEQIMDIVAREGMVERASVAPDATLDSLQLKSADLMMILMAIEEEFEVYIPIDGQLSESRTVADLIDGIAQHIQDARG